MGAREVGEVPGTFAGELPENRAEHPESPGAGGSLPRGPGERDLVSFLNRLLMIEHESIALKEDVLEAETDEATRSRLRDMINEDMRAVEVLERTIRDLHGRVSPFRKVSGRFAGKAWMRLRDLPDRARAVMEHRDINKAQETPAMARFLNYADGHAAESAGHAHWRLLSEVAETTSTRTLQDAVNECERTAATHAEWFDAKARSVARETFTGARLSTPF